MKKKKKPLYATKCERRLRRKTSAATVYNNNDVCAKRYVKLLPTTIMTGEERTTMRFEVNETTTTMNARENESPGERVVFFFLFLSTASGFEISIR